MTIRVFAHCDTPPVSGDELAVGGEERHYAVRVRRVRVGDSLDVFDGHGRCWQAVVLHDSAAGLTVRLVEPRPDPDRPSVTMVLGVPEPPAALDALARCCELGVDEVVWVRTQTSQNGPPSGARVERVVLAAQRQCGRPSPPKISASTFEESLQLPTDRYGLLAHPETATPRGLRLDHARLGCRILVGPPGGLTSAEVSAAEQSGFDTLVLGPWILRTEVATVAAVSTIFALLRYAEV